MNAYPSRKKKLLVGTIGAIAVASSGYMLGVARASIPDPSTSVTDRLAGCAALTVITKAYSRFAGLTCLPSTHSFSEN